MNPFIISFYAIDLSFSRKYDEVIQAFQDALQIEPGYPMALGNLWVPYYFKGQYPKAWEMLHSFLEAYDPKLQGPCEQAYADNGLKGALNAYAAGLELRSEEHYLNPTDIATHYAMTGENDKAI
jgi:tetratricopeptide (TPR) repeat protein